MDLVRLGGGPDQNGRNGGESFGVLGAGTCRGKTSNGSGAIVHLKFKH